MVRTETFQQGMEGSAMVRMAEVAEFVEKDIVPKVIRKPHQIEVQVDVPFPRTTSPIRDIVLDTDLIVLE